MKKEQKKMGKFKELDIIAQDEVESRIRMNCEDMQLDAEYAREYAEWAAAAAEKFKKELEEEEKENVWAIMHPIDHLLYWQEELGWTNVGFTLYSAKEKEKYRKPEYGIWVHLNSL
jgi:hypothetical protein